MIFSLYFSAASIIIFFWLNSLFNYFPFSLEYYNLYNRFLLTGVFATIVFIGCGLDYIRVLRKSNYSLLILLPIIALILILALTLLSDVDKMNNNALILQSQVPKFISDNLSDESIIVSSCPEIFLGDKKIIDYDSYLSLSESSTLSETFLLRDMCYYQRIHSNIIESINSSTSLKIYHIFEREGFIFEIFRVG